MNEKFALHSENKPIGKSGMYRITNLINGKVYIGISKNIKTRATQHLSSNGSAISNAIKKYGASNFLFEPIFYCINPSDICFLPYIEAEKIAEHDSVSSGYNITAANGRVGPYGTAFSKKIIEAHQRKTPAERSEIVRKAKASMSKDRLSEIGKSNALSMGRDPLSERMKAAQASRSAEQKSKNGRIGGIASNAAKSPEQRRQIALHMNAVFLTNTTPEERKEKFLNRSGIARLSKSQLSENGKKGAAATNSKLTPEQRSASARKAALAGAAKRSEIAKKKAESTLPQ